MHEHADVGVVERLDELGALADGAEGVSELRGNAALRDGEQGFDEARRRRLKSIPAEVLLTTRSTADAPGLFHCVVRYRVGGRWYRDDPSARLGMNGRFDPAVRARHAARRIPDRVRRTH